MDDKREQHEKAQIGLILYFDIVFDYVLASDIMDYIMVRVVCCY